MAKEKYGIFGTAECERLQGPVKRLVVIQESGLFAGAPPVEMRIHSHIPFNDEEFGKQFVAKLNRKTDLPFYLTWVEILHRPNTPMLKITDEDLKKEGIEPLKD